MKVKIVITNPNHHLLICLPIARQLRDRGVDVEIISLCEIRRFRTPGELLDKIKIKYKKLDIKLGERKPGPAGGKITFFMRLKSALQRKVFWYLFVYKHVRRWLKGSQALLVLNDTAYPGSYITPLAKRMGLTTYLLQEGIRFPLPVEKKAKYGNSGVDYVICWGNHSKKHFDLVVKPNTKVLPLGSPGFDKSLFIQQDLHSITPNIKTLAIFGNPVDDQKFITHEEKISMYLDLARGIVNYAKKQNRELEVLFKNHPRESAQYLRDLLQVNGLSEVKVYDSKSDIDIVINEVDAGIVFASTVGVNVIVHGKKLAVVKLKGHDYLGDYVKEHVAYKIDIYGPNLQEQLDDFLGDEHYYFRNYRLYLENFASNPGSSDVAIADLILENG